MTYEPAVGGATASATGPTASTKTLSVAGAVKVRTASLPPNPWIVPPLGRIGSFIVMPSESRSSVCT